MTIRWLERTTAANAALGARLADASDALASTLREANSSMVRQGTAGLEHARALGDDMLTGVRRAGMSTRGLIADRPVESVLIVAMVGVAIGWILRRTREPRANAANVPRRSSAATGAARAKRRAGSANK